MGRKIMDSLRKLFKSYRNKAVKKYRNDERCGCPKGQCSCQVGPFK